MKTDQSGRKTEGPMADAVREFLEARGEDYCQNQGITPRRAEELIEACDAFGINPNSDRELLSFRCESASDYEPAWMTLITAGGLKLRVRDGMRRGVDSCDEDTVHRLKLAFGVFQQKPSGEHVERPLPEPLTLSREAVTGMPAATPLQPYRGTYGSRDPGAEARRRERLAATQRNAGD